MGVAATLFGVQHLKGIEQRRSGAAQWLPGPRSIGQKDFPFRTIKSLLLLLFIMCTWKKIDVHVVMVMHNVMYRYVDTVKPVINFTM